jgi:hypothetical protein
MIQIHITKTNHNHKQFIMRTLKTIIIIFAILGLQQNITGQGKSDPSAPLFEVKNDGGQTVFAVYPGGVHIFIDDTPGKAAGGGFSVGRLSTGKATDGDYFTVNPGNVKVIIPNDATKAAGGGFSVGRLSTGKAAGDADYLKVTPDSTRIYVSETSNNGFAVGKLGDVNATDFLNLTPDNYFIGHRAGDSITTGLYNTFIGYQAGVNTTSSDGNVFLGFEAGRGNTVGALNIFIGNGTGFKFTGVEDGEENIFIGNNAGYNCETTANSVFIGTRSGYSCGNSYGNTFIGDRTASFGEARDNNTIIGSAAGFRISGEANVFVGAYAGNGSTSGINNTYIGFQAGSGNATGNNNVFLGYNAGRQEDGSDKLYISNSDTPEPLIYGDFAEGLVQVTGNLYASGEVASNSDARLKTNIIPLTSGLDIILALNGYYYDWNSKAKKEKKLSNEKQIGFVAQEVEKVVPEIVTTAPNGYKAINYTKVAPIIVEAIKEQQKEIETLKKENSELKKQVDEIDKLKKEFEELKKYTENLSELLKNKNIKE